MDGGRTLFKIRNTISKVALILLSYFLSYFKLRSICFDSGNYQTDLKIKYFLESNFWNFTKTKCVQKSKLHLNQRAKATHVI